jgi:hypothetical protein
MKNICFWLFSSLLVARCVNPENADAQTNFQNLDFESASFSNPISGPIAGADYQPVGLGLPGWNASIGGNPVTEVLQNDYTLGEASVDILGPGWGSGPYGIPTDPGIIDGNYTVFLQAFNQAQGNVSLFQTATIPADALSLQFKAWVMLPYSSFSVSFDGNSLSPVALSSGQSPSGQSYEVYGANLGSYAGETGPLEFTANANDNGASWMELDDINFSTTTVTPEPNTLALAVMGGLALAARRWHKRGA